MANPRGQQRDKPFRDAYEWEARTFESVRKVLEFIQPYLIIKETQAKVLAEFLTTHTAEAYQQRRLPDAVYAHRQKLYAMMRILNRRGRPPAETKSECSPKQGDEAIVRTPRIQLGEVAGNERPIPAITLN